MAFKLTHHDKEFFHAEGSKGPFRISKRGLTKQQHAKYVALCNGGSVPQKLAAGGAVDPKVQAAGKDALLAPAQAVADFAYPFVPNAAIAGARSLVNGSPYADERARLDEVERQRRLDQTSSVMDSIPRLPGETTMEGVRRNLRDPVAQQNATDRAMMYMGAAPGGKAPGGKAPAAARAATAAEEAAAAARARGATAGATEARLGMTGGQTAMEAAHDALVARGGTSLDPAVLAAAREKVRGAAGRGGRTGVGLVPWDEMSLPEAQAAARDRAHLSQLDNGQYIGAAPSTNSPAALGALRNKIDKLVAKGAYGGNWYERARAAIKEISNSDPKMADEMSQVLAAYSPQATPDMNFGWAIEQANRTALEGADKAAQWAPKTQTQANTVAKIFKGEHPKLGPKAGVYEQHINPNKAQEAQVRGVNDLWQGRIFGYDPGKDSSSGTGLIAKAGFSDAQHSFMTGENLQAAERAAAKGLLPPGVDPNVGTVQAATWVAQREAKFRADYAKRARTAKENGKPTPPKPSDEEFRRRASQSYDTVLDKYTGNEPHEMIPGRAVEGHMSGVQDLPMQDRAAYTDAAAWSPVGEHDPFYKALGMPSRPTTAGTGQFTSGAGVTDLNPNRVAHPMVSYEPGRVPTFDEAGKPLTKLNSKGKEKPVTAPNSRKGVNAPDETLINSANVVRSAIDAQEAGAWNAPRLSGAGKNSARVRFPSPLSEEATRALYGQAKGAGLDLIDNGGGSFTLAGDLNNGGGMSATEFGKRLKGSKTTPGMGDPLAGARVDRGSFQGGLNGLPWGPEGSGQVTEHMLSKLDPRVEAKLDASPEWRQAVGRKMGVDYDMAKKLGTGVPRSDIQRLRGMISDEGLAGLRAYVAKNGSKGLPAILLPLLASEGQGEETQHHAAGGEVQRFDGGGLVSQMPNPIPDPMLPPPVGPTSQMPVVDPNVAAFIPGGMAPVGMPVGQPTVDPRAAAALTGANNFAANITASPSQEAANAAAFAPGGMQGMVGSPTSGMDPRTGGSAPASIPQPPPGAPAAGAPPLSAAGAPQQAGPQYQAEPPVPLPQIRAWGTGAPGEIAGATREAGYAVRQKAQVEQQFLGDISQMQQRGADMVQMETQRQAQNFQTFQKTRDAMYEEIKNDRINPRQFFDDATTGQKILAGVGMLLSGMGSGLTGQPNLAMEVIQKGIDRNIEAQKFNASKKQNLYAYYTKQGMDDIQVGRYVKADLLDVTAAQIEARKMSMNSATVGPTADLAVQQLRMQSASLRQTAALQELDGAAKSYELQKQQYTLRMIQKMTSMDPSLSPAGGADNSRMIMTLTNIGAQPMANMGSEVVDIPTVGPDGKQMLNANGAPEVTHKIVRRLYTDPASKTEADQIFASIATVTPDVRAAIEILRANPTGVSMYQDPQALARLDTHIAAIKTMYERAVGGTKNQASAQTMDELRNALKNPGGVGDAIWGRSLSALEVIEKQLNDRRIATRAGAIL